MSDSIKFLNIFSIVLFMDNKYKTNKHKLFLVEIIGVASIILTFVAVFVLLANA